MATHRLPIEISRADAGVPVDRVANQISAAAAPSVGELLCHVLADGGADEGVYGLFSVPKNYVGTPKLVVKGILDGSPGASDTLGFSVRKRAVANNEAADGAFDAEQTASATIGSSGLAYADEDLLEMSVSLTAGDYAVDDQVFLYVAIDASGTSFAGNVLLTALEFEYADA
ncbi:MAG: hypothetical protein AB7O32_00565 [Vicinamibacterales bacterium]